MFDLIEMVKKRSVRKPSIVKDILSDPDNCILVAEVVGKDLVIKIRRKEYDEE